MGELLLVPESEKQNSAPLSPTRRRRYGFLIILLLLLSGHLYLTFSDRSYEQAASISLDWFKKHLHWSTPNAPERQVSEEVLLEEEKGPHSRPWKPIMRPTVIDKSPIPTSSVGEGKAIDLEGDAIPNPGHKPQIGLANATFILVVRNRDLTSVMETLAQIEDRFNHRYHYPYTFLSAEPFTDQFKQWTANFVSSKVSYGVIPPEHWNQPDQIDEEKASAGREEMIRSSVIYGGSVEYRNAQRFDSGFFFRHELTQKYRYYWRIEPGVKFFCDIHEDPFMYLQENNKVYGFTISLYEYPRTIPTLWDTVKQFAVANPSYLAEDNAMSFISNDGGNNYNLCHFWNNFEIADMDFWRSEAYTKYFEFLDAQGGFYYERWGKGPVQSIGVSLFARKDQIHFFKEIGYRHEPFQRCPQGELHTKGRCWCDESDNFDYVPYSCTYRYDRLSH